MHRKIIRYHQIDSTNSEASRLLSSGKVRGEAYVIADTQENGRGQSDHAWVSEVGKNILMTWMIEPAFLSVGSQFQLSKSVSLAVTDLLDSCNLNSLIKWPNDILCKNRKIAGILIENRVMGDKLQGSIIGIGLNVNQQQFPDFPFKATSMCLEGGEDYSLSEIESKLMNRLEGRYAQLRDAKEDHVSQEYNARIFRLNQRSDFRVGESRISGKLRGVDKRGELLIETQEGTRSYGFHEVRMVP